MKGYIKVFIIMITALFPAGLFAANSDTTTINYEVQAINEINLDGGTYSVTVSEATAGIEPDPNTYDGTYDITTNCGTDAKKITAQINSDMPANIYLWLDVIAPSGASSFPEYISATPINAVTLIDANASSNLAFFLDLEAEVAGGVVASASKTLTLTLTDQ